MNTAQPTNTFAPPQGVYTHQQRVLSQAPTLTSSIRAGSARGNYSGGN